MARLADLTGSLDDEPDDDPQTARVVRSGPDGVHVVPIGADTRDPIGPCMGSRRRDATGELKPYPIGTIVLLVTTDDGPWVAAADE